MVTLSQVVTKYRFNCTLQTIVAVVVLPIPGGPDNRAALNPAPVSSLTTNLPVIKNKIYL